MPIFAVMRLRELLLIPILLLLPHISHAQGGNGPQVDHTLNWQTGFLEISVTMESGDTGSPQAAQLYRTQREIERLFPSILFDGVLPLQVDSVHTVRDQVNRNPALSSRITEITARTQRGLPRPSADLTQVTQQFRVPIFPDLAQLFVTHQIPFRMEQVVRWVPTEEFTGVVIHAALPLRHRGTREETLLQPAIFPEIYDTDLRPVLEQDMLIPEVLRRWGVVAYAESFDEDPWRNRIGANPLRIMAREVFGVSPVDIVISPEDADRLLSSRHNREMLRQGRILVILAPGQTIGR